MTESVWDYPRPPALVPCERRVRVVLGGVTVADSRAALRVLETSHPPTIYVPPADIEPACIQAAAGRSFCEWKGIASYLDVVAGERRQARAVQGRVRHAPLVRRRSPQPMPRVHLVYSLRPGECGACCRDEPSAQSEPRWART
jgi:hypothetical protein